MTGQVPVDLPLTVPTMNLCSEETPDGRDFDLIDKKSFFLIDKYPDLVTLFSLT